METTDGMTVRQSQLNTSGYASDFALKSTDKAYRQNQNMQRTAFILQERERASCAGRSF